MKEFDTRPVWGECDFVDEEHCILVTGQKKQYPGQSAPVFIPTAYECEYQDECQCGNNCPIYRNAHMNW